MQKYNFFSNQKQKTKKKLHIMEVKIFIFSKIMKEEKVKLFSNYFERNIIKKKKLKPFVSY